MVLILFMISSFKFKKCRSEIITYEILIFFYLVVNTETGNGNPMLKKALPLNQLYLSDLVKNQENIVLIQQDA